jgi:hypothetical protein
MPACPLFSAKANPAEPIHILRDALVQRVCDALAIGRLEQFAGVVGIGEERDFGKDRRHVGTDENDQGSLFLPPRSLSPGLPCSRPL